MSEWYFDQRRDDVRRMLADATGTWVAFSDRRLVRIPDDAYRRAVERFVVGGEDESNQAFLEAIASVVGTPIPPIEAIINRRIWDNQASSKGRPDSSDIEPQQLVTLPVLAWLQGRIAGDRVLVGIALDERHPLVPLLVPEQPEPRYAVFEVTHPTRPDGIRMRVLALPCTALGALMSMSGYDEAAAKISVVPPDGHVWLVAGNSQRFVVDTVSTTTTARTGSRTPSPGAKGES